jgi:hypothetical protein
MGERGLQEPVHTACGVTEPARRVGISRHSVSSRLPFPAERMLSVEAVMDVARAILLEPDPGGDEPAGIDAGGAARVQGNPRTRR